MMVNQNPYKGPFTFETEDESRFFGREKEVDEVIHLIQNCQLITLFGASGTGKTSMIKARLLPQLRREFFHPIYIRMNFESDDPLEYTKQRITEELFRNYPNIDSCSPDQTLIEYAANTVIFDGLVKPVLFFDQFEELFTLGPKNPNLHSINDFLLQLADLIEFRLPGHLKNIEHINNLQKFKVVFSLRQDWVAYLEDYTDIIPSILETRYRIRRFSSSQALDAVLLPAATVINRETATLIIDNVGEATLSRNVKNSESDNKSIDPFVLSLYAYQLYEKARGSGDCLITRELVNSYGHEKLIRTYYDEHTENYPELKKMIEDRLLNESGKRISIPFSSLPPGMREQFLAFEKQSGIVKLLGKNLQSGELEIVHDKLAKEIFASKSERLVNEKKRVAEKIEADIRLKDKEADILRQKAKHAKRTTLIVSATTLFVVGILVFLTIKKSRESVALANQQARDVVDRAKADYTVQGLRGQMAVYRDSLETLYTKRAILLRRIDSARINAGHEKETGIAYLNLQLTETKQTINDKDNKIKNLENKLDENEKKYQRANETIEQQNQRINDLQKKPIKENTAISTSSIKLSGAAVQNISNSDGHFSARNIIENGFIVQFDLAVTGSAYNNSTIRLVLQKEGTSIKYIGSVRVATLVQDPSKVITIPIENIEAGLYQYSIVCVTTSSTESLLSANRIHIARF